MLHSAEFRRCLLTLDVIGMSRLHEHTAPHLPRQTPAEILCAMHMARVEMKTCPKKLKIYSTDWLRERGYEKNKYGGWSYGPPSDGIISEAVGIASKSNTPGLSKTIVQAMTDALLNGMVKGIVEPEHQREIMLKARSKIRFKGRHI